MAVKPCRTKFSPLALSLAAALAVFPSCAGAAPLDTAGAALNRAREAIERERIAQEIQEDQEARNAKVEQEKEQNDAQAEAVTFTLQSVRMDESEILTREELDELAADYIGRTVSLKDLYDLVEKINALYEKKGFMTCRAFLPPQRIHEGEVTIRLVEGKTGDISVHGNAHTKENYVKENFSVTQGTIANTDKLTRELQHFNGAHDVQLRMVMRAGKEPGTTDYEILVYEPIKNESVTLFVDNNGYETSGRWREGLFYLNKSVSGFRDSLQANYQRSQGTDIWGLGYTFPLNRHGMKLSIDYSGNQTRITDGLLQPIGVEGKAYAFSMALRNPYLVDANRRFEFGLQLIRQHSETTFGPANTHWINDHTTQVSPYVSFTHYGDSYVLFHKHSLARTFRKDRDGESFETWNWRLDAIYQKQYKAGQTLMARFDGQLTNSSALAGVDTFYIGGVSTVRGYEESLLRGDDGFTASLEYQVPLTPDRNVRALAFLDYGKVYGRDVQSDADMLISTGVGVMASFKDVSTSLVLGMPLQRWVAQEKQDAARLHFLITANF